MNEDIGAVKIQRYGDKYCLRLYSNTTEGWFFGAALMDTVEEAQEWAEYHYPKASIEHVSDQHQ